MYKNLLEHTTNWAKGEMLQGRIMLIVGFAILVSIFGIIRGQQELLKGMLLPLGLLLLICFGYGGFQVFGRLAHIQKVTEIYNIDRREAHQMEYEKAVKDDRAYTLLKKVWPALLILSVLAYFLVSKDYYKGMTIGFMGLFVSTLLVDSLLHYRLMTYLEHLQNQ